MTTTLIFMAVLMIVVAWWLLKQTMDTQPWEESTMGAIVGGHGGRSFIQVDKKLGLFVFLAVATSLFSLFISAYMMRMELGDWRPLKDPSLLWWNTGALVLSSVAMQWARSNSKHGQTSRLRYAVLLGGFFAVAFMFGQWQAWQQLNTLGFFAYTNPAYAFFYLMTGLHALHLMGGLVVWCLAAIKLLRGVELSKVTLSIELCAVYWHFLLLIWIILFGLLLST
ncbi:MAG: cytochrome c oxidase subunit 3 [Cycloclasticus sp.]|nr:cytochrome c oxidase subunit 3 [Gammaproteobacteria bacterium]MBQ0790233.1 cytochrome c oxidase subunit 3 [Cycloclasticus sp.]